MSFYEMYKFINYKDHLYFFFILFLILQFALQSLIHFSELIHLDG